MTTPAETTHDAEREAEHLGPESVRALRGHPLSTLIAAREEQLLAAFPGWSVRQPSSGLRASTSAPDVAPVAFRPQGDASVDLVRLEALPHVRFTAPSLVRLCEALGIPEIDEVTGQRTLAFADFSQADAPVEGDLHVIERVSDVVRDALAEIDVDAAREAIVAYEARSRSLHEERLAAWVEASSPKPASRPASLLARWFRREPTSGVVSVAAPSVAAPAPAPPPPLRVPLDAILRLTKDAARAGVPLHLWSVSFRDASGA